MWRRGVEPVARPLAATGISPNTLTAMGLAGNLAAAVIVAMGSYFAGGAIFFVASAFDSLDGAVARAGKRATPFGAFLDSLLDRYSEAAIFAALVVRAHWDGDTWLLLASMLALVGSLLVSYCRARAEGLGIDCEVGLFQRPERVIILGAGLVISGLLLAPAVWVLAAITNVTVVQRSVHVYREAAKRRSSPL